VGGYVQDDWKLTPRLTLNLGLRYELWTQPVERNDRQANFLVNDGKLIFANNQVPAGVPASLVEPVPGGIGARSLMKTDTNNFAPRLGLAYQMTKNTVLRAGAGVFFADDPAIGASARLVANPPFFQSTTYATDQINPILNLSTGFPANAIGQNVNISAATLSSWAQNMKQAYVYHWSFGIQQQWRDTIFDVNYVGTKGNDLATTFNINTPAAGPGSVASRRRYQGLGDINYTSGLDTSSYNALEARIEHRYARGFSLLASYTYSKTLDIGGESLVGDLSLRDATNVRAERSLSSGDMRHRFVTSALYDLPLGHGRRMDIQNRLLNAIVGGWQLNAILTIHNGTPFTPALGTSSANTGAARPNRIADGNLPSDQRSVANWFDKTAFVAPTPYNFGNAGRDILIGPGASNLDSSPQFGLPNSRVDIANGGTITTLTNDMREIQFAVKILF
jgi:TonB dependent receptor